MRGIDPAPEITSRHQVEFDDIGDGDVPGGAILDNRLGILRFIVGAVEAYDQNAHQPLPVCRGQSTRPSGEINRIERHWNRGERVGQARTCLHLLPETTRAVFDV
ncbi:MAG: hypothetical protein CMD83_10300 [Gammaproteobacteria bacterium]|nr:hypothetical protein [Gammaproteobacteria bacterium]